MGLNKRVPEDARSFQEAPDLQKELDNYKRLAFMASEGFMAVSPYDAAFQLSGVGPDDEHFFEIEVAPDGSGLPQEIFGSQTLTKMRGDYDQKLAKELKDPRVRRGPDPEGTSAGESRPSLCFSLVFDAKGNRLRVEAFLYEHLVVTDSKQDEYGNQISVTTWKILRGEIRSCGGDSFSGSRGSLFKGVRNELGRRAIEYMNRVHELRMKLTKGT